MRLFDSHAHLTDEWLGDPGDVIAAARAAGVDRICVIGTDIEDSVAAQAVSAEYGLCCAAGVHPHAAGELELCEADRLRELLRLDGMVALGEIGLDYHYDGEWKTAQKAWFEAQLELASELDLPVIIHDREAHADVLSTLKAFKGKLRRGGIVHCYSGSYEMAMDCIEMGYYISFSGSVTFKNASKLQLVAARLPLERLLIETDSPYLTPEPIRKVRPNAPAHVLHVAEGIARVKDMQVAEIAEITYRNACAVFGLDA